MLYLEIDIGQNNHIASLLNDNGKSVFNAFAFSNTTDGATSLLDKLSSWGVTSSNTEIFIQATVTTG